MTLSPKLEMALCLTFALAACGSDTNDLAFADESSEVAELTAVSDTSNGIEAPEIETAPQIELITTNATELTPSTAAPITTAPTTSAAPSTTTPPTTETTVAPPTTDTTVAPTTTPPTTEPTSTAVTCETDRYTIELPADWFHRDCNAISPAELFDLNNPPETEWANEITASFISTESFAEVIDRIDLTRNVISSESITVDGLPAERFTTTYEWWRTGELQIVVVDAGDGAFMISADQLADTADNVNWAGLSDIDARYTHTLAGFEHILATIEIDEGPSTTVGYSPGIASFSPILCATGEFGVNLRPGYSQEYAAIAHANSDTTWMLTDDDGRYQIENWPVPNDIVAAYVAYSEGEDTLFKRIDNNCGDVLGGNYNTCTGDFVSIVYPTSLDSNLDLGAYGDNVGRCAFFRDGPEDGHQGNAITLTSYPGLTPTEVRADAMEFGNWVLDAPDHQGGPREAYNRLHSQNGTEIVGRAWLIPAPDGTYWFLEAYISGLVSVDDIDDMANNIVFN